MRVWMHENKSKLSKCVHINKTVLITLASCVWKAGRSSHSCDSNNRCVFARACVYVSNVHVYVIQHICAH